MPEAKVVLSHSVPILGVVDNAMSMPFGVILRSIAELGRHIVGTSQIVTGEITADPAYQLQW